MPLWNELFSLEGDAVRLVPLKLTDADALWRAGEPEEIWTYMATAVRSKEEMEAVVASAIQEREKGIQYPFAVVSVSDGAIVGSTRFLDISEVNKSLEIGWTWYHPSVWRTRINTESKYLLLQHAFGKWGLNRVQFKTDARNVRSQQAIARLGAVKEGTLRKDRIIRNNFARDSVYFSILNEEWPDVKKKLLEKLK
ncbi:GNAT family N-acetyltransferase [Bacillus sp. V3-13]|nr:GNAT family N-acetyltransferase [Bacillus sp. V3-13]